MGWQIIPGLTKAGIGLLKASPKIAAGAGITTAVGGGLSAGAVRIPLVNEILEQTPEQQAEKRAGSLKRGSGELDRSLTEKWFDFFGGRDLTAVDPNDPKGRSYIQKASDEKVLKNNSYATAKLEKALKQLPGLSKVELAPNMTEEQYKIAVAQELANYEEALRIKALGGTLPEKITSSTLAAAEQTTPTSATQQLERADNQRAEDRLDTKNRELRLERRYLNELEASREQRANQFALQMAQNDYNNRSLDLRDARETRKDKQLMIMQLMKGLSDMGKAFAY